MSDNAFEELSRKLRDMAKNKDNDNSYNDGLREAADQIDMIAMPIDVLRHDGSDLDALAARVHEANKLWWYDIETGRKLKRNIGELLMLSVTELAEALEGDRKGLQDDKLPQYRMFDVEIIDTLIRLFDICGALIPEAGEIFEAKMEYNRNRHDHSIEGRKAEGGKKY